MKEACGMCNNANIDEDLTPDTDYSAFPIGSSITGRRMMLCSGWNRPLRIEVEEWSERTGWFKIGEYKPKFCPNCGREIVEYNNDNNRERK